MPKRRKERDIPRSAIMLVKSDINIGIIYASPSINDVLGWEPEDLVGKSTYILLHPEGTIALKFLYALICIN